MVAKTCAKNVDAHPGKIVAPRPKRNKIEMEALRKAAAAQAQQDKDEFDAKLARVTAIEDQMDLDDIETAENERTLPKQRQRLQRHYTSLGLQPDSTSPTSNDDKELVQAATKKALKSDEDGMISTDLDERPKKRKAKKKVSSNVVNTLEHKLTTLPPDSTCSGSVCAVIHRFRR